MAWKRIKEAIALLLIGDGIISILEPRRHTKLWVAGPGLYHRAMSPLKRRPIAAQAVGLALIGVGLWLAQRQKA
jgi:hypothetical protein